MLVGETVDVGEGVFVGERVIVYVGVNVGVLVGTPTENDTHICACGFGAPFAYILQSLTPTMA